jgi:hypothetical protein
MNNPLLEAKFEATYPILQNIISSRVKLTNMSNLEKNKVLNTLVTHNPILDEDDVVKGSIKSNAQLPSMQWFQVNLGHELLYTSDDTIDYLMHDLNV